MTRRPHPRRGFSLIESAIVLGIIGLIIGGIWVAAAAVSNRNRINDAIALILLAHEEAIQHKKNFSSSDWLAPILAIKPLPGNYKLTGANQFLSNGQQWLWSWGGVNSGVPYFTGWFYVNATSTSISSGRPKPDLCLELSKKLLNTNLGVGGTLGWYTNLLATVGTYTQGSAKPGITTLSTYCQTTAILSFNWKL